MIMTEPSADRDARATGDGRLAALETKIDLLTDRLALLTGEAEQRARQRRMFEELGGDLNRISGDAMDLLTRELESLTATADLADTVRLLRRFVEAAPTLDLALVALTQAAALVDDLAPLGTDVMESITGRLGEADRKGYFTFARAGARIADRVVTSFDEDDLDQLGDNVVTILDTVRQVTQPELLALLGRMVEAVRAEQRIDDAHGDAPSLWGIVKELRDPDVRRGMAHALHTLRAVSAHPNSPDCTAAESPSPNPNRKGDDT